MIVNTRLCSVERNQMKECKDSELIVSQQAFSCPGFGAPCPVKEKWDGWGVEYMSRTMLIGLPLVHISLEYSPKAEIF